MHVVDRMSRNVVLATLKMPLQEAAQKMKQGDLGSLPVADNDRLVGMITDRDIVIRAVAEGMDPARTPVSSVMSHKMIYCFEDQTLLEAERFMETNQIRRLPVLNRQKRLVGILSIGDIAGALGEAANVGKTLGRISEPGHGAPQLISSAFNAPI
jgi:CBS domain-containing protein